jgi:hypothetical protein
MKKTKSAANSLKQQVRARSCNETYHVRAHAMGDMSQIWEKRRFCAAGRSLTGSVRGEARPLKAEER